ncbi:SpoIIE family protein phosphatase [Streptomyces sp. NPDC001953]
MGASHATERGGHSEVAHPEDPAAHILVDDRGTVAGWSSAAQRLLGYPVHAMLGRPVTDLLADTGPPTDPRPADDTFAVRLRHADGAVVSCQVGIRPEHAGQTGTRWQVTLACAQEESPTAELDHALLDTLFTASPVGLYLLDPQLRIIRFNPAAEGMENTSMAEAVGRRPTEVWPDFAVEMVERIMGQVRDTRQSAIAVEKRMYPPGDPDHEHVYSASVFPLEDSHGRLLGIADATIDVTARHLAKERLNVLALAGTRIGATLDVLDTARGLAEVSVPGLADGMAVEVLESVLAGEDLVPGPVQPDTVLRRAIVRIRDEEDPATVGDPEGRVSAAEALADFQPRILDPLSAVGRRAMAGLPTHRDMPHSLMVVPLVAQDRALGLATFCRWGARRPFEQDDLTLAAELAQRTAACLDNGRRYLRERNSVAALQHAVRPDGVLPEHTMDAAHAYVQAGSGGDWVDAVPLSGARVALAAGRAPGQGLQTAAAAGRLRAAVHTLSDMDLQPDELLARLDDLARRLSKEDRHNAPPPVPDSEAREAGATCLYLIYDPVSLRCSMASAGHPWPVIVHPDGTTVSLDHPIGAPLCCSDGPFEKIDLDLPEHSMLALYTPGLFQEQSEALAREHIADLLTGYTGSVRQACSMLTQALVPPHPREDAVVKVARTHSLSPARVVSWDLPSDPSVVSIARSLVTEQLTSWDMSETTFTTELIASELVTNAIRYAKPPVRLRLIRGHVLTCEVSDGSSTSPRLRHARTTDEGGRGLLLAARLSERWGTRYTDDGKTVWVEQSIPELATV